jgi:hypothetical protein
MPKDIYEIHATLSEKIRANYAKRNDDPPSIFFNGFFGPSYLFWITGSFIGG